jgi:hypothetical protein
MAQWEYSKLDLNDAPRKTDDIDLLNDAGKDGWELVGILSNNVAYLKRQVGAPAPARTVRRKAATTPAD